MLAATDERMTILKMIDEHKITADQGAQLLSAMEKSASNEPSDQFLTDKGDKSSGRARVFRVLVTDTQTGKTRTSVTLPLSLVKWGLKIGTQYSREINGVDLNVIDDILTSGAEGKIIEVIDEEDGEQVQIFVD